MSDQVTINPRHPSVSVEDLIERLHADGWDVVTCQVAADGLSDGRRRVARASRRVDETGDGPRWVEYGEAGGGRSIEHREWWVDASSWGHAVADAMSGLVEMLDACYLGEVAS